MTDDKMYNGYVPEPEEREELAPAPAPAEPAGGGSPNFYPTCRFCGKQQLPLAPYPDKETADEAATMQCDCYDARLYQKEVERQQEREKNIVRLRQRLDDLAEYCNGRGVPLEGDTLDLLMHLGTNVLDGLINAATVKWTRLRVNISTNNKGAIVIGFNYTDAAKIEV